MTRFLQGLAAAVAAASLLTGCGETAGGPPGQAVSGVVTLDGRPLESGSIVFVPVDAAGEPTGGPVKDGAFAIPAKDGPAPGVYVVSVYSRKSTGKTMPDPNDPDATIEEGFESIPAKYNVASTLKAEVAEGDDNRFEYELEGALTSPPKGARSVP